MLSGFVVLAALGIHVVKAQSLPDSRAIEKTHAKIEKLGVGRDARVEVTLRGSTKLKGYIASSGSDNFILTDRKTGASQTVAYADVTQVKKSGSGFSTRNWIIVGAAVAATVIVGLTVIKPVLCDGGAGC